jgi:hypothetical protein
MQPLKDFLLLSSSNKLAYFFFPFLSPLPFNHFPIFTRDCRVTSVINQIKTSLTVSVIPQSRSKVVCWDSS